MDVLALVVAGDGFAPDVTVFAADVAEDAFVGDEEEALDRRDMGRIVWGSCWGGLAAIGICAFIGLGWWWVGKILDEEEEEDEELDELDEDEAKPTDEADDILTPIGWCEWPLVKCGLLFEFVVSDLFKAILFVLEFGVDAEVVVVEEIFVVEDGIDRFNGASMIIFLIGAVGKSCDGVVMTGLFGVVVVETKSFPDPFCCSFVVEETAVGAVVLELSDVVASVSVIAVSSFDIGVGEVDELILAVSASAAVESEFVLAITKVGEFVILVELWKKLKNLNKLPIIFC